MNNNCIELSAFFKGKPNLPRSLSHVDNQFYDCSKDVMGFFSPSTPYEAKRDGFSYILGLGENDKKHMFEQNIKVRSISDIYDYMNVLDTHPKTKDLDAYYVSTDLGHIVLEKGDDARKAVDTILEELMRKELELNPTNFMLSAFFSRRVDRFISGKQLRLSHMVYDLNNKNELGKAGFTMIVIPRRVMETKTFVRTDNQYELRYDHNPLRKYEPLFWDCVPTKPDHNFYSLRDIESRLKSKGLKGDLTTYTQSDLLNVFVRDYSSRDPQTKFVGADPTYCPAPKTYPVVDLKEVSIASLSCRSSGKPLDLPFFDEHKQIAFKHAKNTIKKIKISKEQGLEY